MGNNNTIHWNIFWFPPSTKVFRFAEEYLTVEGKTTIQWNDFGVDTLQITQWVKGCLGWLCTWKHPTDCYVVEYIRKAGRKSEKKAMVTHTRAPPLGRLAQLPSENISEWCEAYVYKFGSNVLMKTGSTLYHNSAKKCDWNRATVEISKMNEVYENHKDIAGTLNDLRAANRQDWWMNQFSKRNQLREERNIVKSPSHKHEAHFKTKNRVRRKKNRNKREGIEKQKRTGKPGGLETLAKVHWQ